MARKKTEKSRSAPKPSAREQVSRMVRQVKEPLSLLGTLKEEGLANAAALLSLAGAVASGASRNLRVEQLRAQLAELAGSLGFATREELEKLEARIDELEHKLSEKEFEALRVSDEE